MVFTPTRLRCRFRLCQTVVTSPEGQLPRPAVPFWDNSRKVLLGKYGEARSHLGQSKVLNPFFASYPVLQPTRPPLTFHLVFMNELRVAADIKNHWDNENHQSKERITMNCWEVKKCGREQGGAKAAELGICVAYPDHGNHCAKITGTLCGGKVQGSFAVKLANCLDCNFYQSSHYDKKWVAPNG